MNQKLKSAMTQIQRILELNDIAGVVVLHQPGHCEYLNFVFPSYSCAKPSKDGRGLHLKAKLLQDFNGNRVAHKKKITETANMFHILGLKTGEISLNLLDVNSHLMSKFDITHTKAIDDTQDLSNQN